MKIGHFIKIFFLRFKWRFDTWKKAVEFKKNIKDYRFIREKRKHLHDTYLEFERNKYPLDQLDSMKEKINLMDEILNHVDDRK